jgi:hypothetical protein
MEAMTIREMAAELLALREERDELKAGLIEAASLLAGLGAALPHTDDGDCLHCAYVRRAAEVGRPLERYRAEFAAEVAAFRRDQPERYAEIRRAVLGLPAS